MTARIVTKLALAVASPIVAFACADFAVQAFDFVPARQSPISFWGSAHDEVFERSEGAFRPNLDWFWEPKPGAIFYDDPINADGYRGPLYPKKKTPGRLRILTLGDSSTMCFNIREPDGWPRRLEGLLREKGHDVEVVNFGVVGFSVFQARRLYLGRARAYQPDVVIVACGAINDQYLAEQQLDDEARAAIFASPGYRARELASRFTIFRWLERALGHHTFASYSAPHVAAPGEEPVVRVLPEEFERCIEDIYRAQKEDGHEFAVVCPPRMAALERDMPRTVRYTEAVHRVTQRLGVPHVPVYERFREMEEKTKEPGSFPTSNGEFLDVVHPSAVGHAVYANLVAQELLNAGYVK